MYLSNALDLHRILHRRPTTLCHIAGTHSNSTERFLYYSVIFYTLHYSVRYNLYYTILRALSRCYLCHSRPTESIPKYRSTNLCSSMMTARLVAMVDLANVLGTRCLIIHCPTITTISGATRVRIHGCGLVQRTRYLALFSPYLYLY